MPRVDRACPESQAPAAGPGGPVLSPYLRLRRYWRLRKRRAQGRARFRMGGNGDTHCAKALHYLVWNGGNL